MMQIRSISLLLTLVAVAGCERPTTISGAARVVDGDSIEIATTSIRIHGIDAPEGRQSCLRDGVVWDCGLTATRKMQQLVANRAVVCTQTDIDNYGRTVARCRNGDIDLGAEMVLAGLALAYRQYGNDYVGEEARAEAVQAGIWAGEFTAPWDWRRNPVNPVGQAAPTPAATDADCQIKGNINRQGVHIYHVPGSRSYPQTVINESRGERWFCSEAEAVRAGWRAPRG